MRSPSADAVARLRAERVAAMTPDERMALAARLGEESIAVYAAAHELDRAAALARVKAARRLGRRRSGSAEAK
jgi:GGDEF domain-containing protein